MPEAPEEEDELPRLRLIGTDPSEPQEFAL